MALVPISNVLNDSLTGFNMDVRGSSDTANRTKLNTVFGEAINTNRIDDISILFQYNIADYVVTPVTSGTGEITNPHSMCQLSTGLGTGSAGFTSKSSIRYRPGHEAYAYFTAAFSTPDALTTQKIGVFDDDDGFFIGYNGTQFGFTYRNGGVDTFIPQTAWTGNSLLGPEGFVLDTSFINIYRISYGWLGVAPVVLEVSTDGGNSWTVAHKQDFRNKQTTPSIANPVLPLRAEVTSSGTITTPVTLSTPSLAAGTMNSAGIMEGSASDRYFNFSSGEKTISSNIWTNLVTVRNPITYKTKKNHVSTKVLSISSSNIGNRFVQFRFVREPVVSGTPVFNPVDVNNSVLEFDTAGTIVDLGTSGGTLFSMSSGPGASSLDDLSSYGITIRPGETVSLAAFSTATSDIVVNLREREMF